MRKCRYQFDTSPVSYALTRYTHIHTHTYMHIHTCTFTHSHTHTHIYKHTRHMHIHAHAHTHTHTQTRTHKTHTHEAHGCVPQRVYIECRYARVCVRVCVSACMSASMSCVGIRARVYVCVSFSSSTLLRYKTQLMNAFEFPPMRSLTRDPTLTLHDAIPGILNQLETNHRYNINTNTSTVNTNFNMMTHVGICWLVCCKRSGRMLAATCVCVCMYVCVLSVDVCVCMVCLVCLLIGMLSACLVYA